MTPPPGTRARLENQLVVCRARLASLGTVDGARLPSDAMDAAQEMRDRGEALTERVALMEVIRACGDAILLVDAGIYGACTHCGEAIAEARLAALPWAMRCLPCQARVEDAEKVTHQNGRRGGRRDHDEDDVA